MSNPAIGLGGSTGVAAYAAGYGANVPSANNPNEFYGYGTAFMNPNQFVLDISERIHLFGADASPFFSWSSMVRKSPAKGVDFSWMEDELFTHRDVKCLLARYCPTGATNGNCVYTLKIQHGGDWQAFEAAPLADAYTQSTTNLSANLTSPTICLSIKANSAEILVLPLAYGLAEGPKTRTWTPSTGTAFTINNELILADNSNGTITVGTNATNASNHYLKHVMSHHGTGSYPAAGLTLTSTILNTLFSAGAPVAGASDTIVCTVRTYTPNEIHQGFAQGSGLPTESRKRSRTFKNYVQIFKTPYSIANTLQAVQMYGGNELAKLRYKKAIQHKVDIERAILFQGGGNMDSATAPNWGYVGGTTSENPITRFKGLGVGATSIANAGFISTKNGGWDSGFTLAHDGSATQANLNDLAGRIFEDTVDTPSSSKLVFASKKWMGMLSLMALKQDTANYRWGNVGQKDGRLGMKIRTLETPFGDLNFVDMPHFRGEFENYALVCDMNNIEIKPLRDTQLIANCGEKTVDGQIDYYITELGFECRFESTHAILKLT
jgi:hypothetical protein